MICEQPSHHGDRNVTRLRFIDHDGRGQWGCYQCTDDWLHSMYPTTKRMKTLPDGKTFWISPAHERDIKTRRVAKDLSGVWRDRKGIGGNMKY